MPARHRFSVALVGVSTVVLSVLAVPALSSPAAAATTPTCQLASPESMSGFSVVNNMTVNGTWTYSTGAACTSNIADIALYEELDFNGAKVDSKLKGFTGSPHQLDAITSTFHCSACNGSWVFKWGQILKAPTPVTFVNPPSGCVLLNGGLYEVCVQTKTVNI